MGRNRKLNARRRHRLSPYRICDVYKHNLGASFFKRPEMVAFATWINSLGNGRTKQFGWRVAGTFNA
jgi:hypothetical protein